MSPYWMSPPDCTHNTRGRRSSCFARLDKVPTSLILPVFGFSTYEIPSYDFGADVVPLQPFVDRALGIDHISPYWPSLACFCILSHSLLLNGIDGYGSLRLVAIVE
ncbi:hypothetical protein JCGZ_01707 [Jatropha curcas]|uniref:Uncharacterized protein n=1 Tax=Jatropha curcas TaxID=180498 RepID=A0A067LDT0_JATCU|nr:hypothetical protein JCGZ_01707 [Jatropha curcas]